jgi:hypothetical protein
MRKCVFWPMLAFSLVMADLGQAQPQTAAQVLAAVCAKVPCRKDGRTLVLRMPDNRGLEARTQPYPYLDDHGTVILYAGETITIGFNKNGDGLGAPVLLKVSDPDGAVDIGAAGTAAASLSFTLKQDEGKPGMMLTAANGVPATLKYSLQMFVPTADGVRSGHSSTCPLMAPPGGVASFGGFESWPHPILMVAIADIRMLPAGAPSTCN